MYLGTTFFSPHQDLNQEHGGFLAGMIQYSEQNIPHFMSHH
jgi:hypothetical protein